MQGVAVKFDDGVGLAQGYVFSWCCLVQHCLRRWWCGNALLWFVAGFYFQMEREWSVAILAIVLIYITH